MQIYARPVCDKGMNDVVDLLATLVACPSVNPNRSTTFERPFGEAALVAHLKSYLKSLGADVLVSEVHPGRPNILARIQGRRDDVVLLFEAHSDTVQVHDMSIEPFVPKQCDGRVYGRGACDTKGSMAAMLTAIARITREGRPPVTLCFASTCDEEVGATGAKALMESGLRVNAAVVGEPTDLNVVHAHKGVLHWTLEVSGLSAHSSMPERGVSAIYPMAGIITAIDTRLRAALSKRTDAQLGHPTVSVGMVNGGTQVNIVPSRCTAIIDRRLLPEENVASATHELQVLIDEVMVAFPDASAMLSAVDHYPPLKTSRDAGVARLALDAAHMSLPRASFVTAPWGSNAGVFDAAGVPAVLFGPGSIRQAHTRDEFIEISELRAAVDVYEQIIRRSGDAGYLV